MFQHFTDRRLSPIMIKTIWGVSSISNPPGILVPSWMFVKVRSQTISSDHLTLEQKHQGRLHFSSSHLSAVSGAGVVVAGAGVVATLTNHYKKDLLQYIHSFLHSQELKESQCLPDRLSLSVTCFLEHSILHLSLSSLSQVSLSHLS